MLYNPNVVHTNSYGLHKLVMWATIEHLNNITWNTYRTVYIRHMGVTT